MERPSQEIEHKPAETPDRESRVIQRVPRRGWVGLLADAGRKKLTTWVLGSDQERALQPAAKAAIQRTAAQFAPAGSEQAEHVVRVVSEVFHEPTEDAAVGGQATLLQALQAGIAGQLAVLDDADRTGTGQSPAEVLGVSGSALAEALANHLVRETMFRGSGGGPLAPLADQPGRMRDRGRGPFARAPGSLRMRSTARPSTCRRHWGTRRG